MNWYALQVKSNAERSVQDRLKLAGIEDFTPFYAVPSRRRDRSVPPVERPLFPGYLFAHLEIAQHQPSIERIPNILRVVGYGDRHPVVIEDQQIEFIRLLTVSPFPIRSEPFQNFREQDSVLVTEGPLAGLEGTVVYAPVGRPRIVISVPMLHRAVSAEVEAEWLQRIPKAS